MGICFTKKTIEEIVQSKYTLAKDSKSKEKTSQCYHVYLWKYTSDDLSMKDVKLYNCEEFPNQTPLNNKNVQNDDSQSEQPQFLQGQPLKWPIKAHADQGYIVLTIKNNKQFLENRLNGASAQNGQTPTLRNQKVSLEMLQILYMIHLDSFKSYYFTEVKQQKQNNEFQASIEIIAGDLLDKIDCLKLVTISFELEKYLQIGGQNVFKKFYNEYENIAYFDSQNIRTTQSSVPKREALKNNIIPQEFQKTSENNEIYVSNQLEVSRIVLSEIKRIQNSQHFQNEEQKELEIDKIFTNMQKNYSKFNILAISLLYGVQRIIGKGRSQTYQDKKNLNFVSKQISRPIIQKLSSQKDSQSQKINVFYTLSKKDASNKVQTKQKQLKGLKFDDFQNLDMDNNDISIIEKPQGQKNKKYDTKNQMLDSSSPFICEITQIGGLQQSFDAGLIGDKDFGMGKMEKKTSKFSKKDEILHQNGDIQDSLFLPKQLQELRIDRNFYKITPNLNEVPQCNLILTTYAGSSQFQQLQKQNVSLIMNMSPSECYNYFIHDLSYDWYDLEPLHKTLTEDELFSEEIDSVRGDSQYLYNIECLIFGIIGQINAEIEAEKEGGNLRPTKVAIFCSHKNMVYSGTIAVAYLMFTNAFRLNLEQAYQSVRESTKNKFQIPKIYETQLRDLQKRIDESSSTANLNSLNTKSSSYKGYAIGLYSAKNSSVIANRYIGQLSSTNQLQMLENNGFQTYLLVPNNLTSIIMKTINIMREDSSLLSSGNNTEKIKNISKLIKNMGLSLRLFSGKQVSNKQKQFYLSFVKDHLISQLVRYEYMNFPKKIFNIQKYQSKLDLIIEALKQLITQQIVEKSFRKPQPYEQLSLSFVKDIELLKATPIGSRQGQIMPFNSKQTLTFKYPILRPIFEGKKKDSYYFMIKKFQDKSEKKTNGMGCNVTFFKGQNWIGLQQDKERYFQKIVQEYLKDVSEQRIWIEDQDDSGAEKSLFDRDSMIF